MEIADLSSLGGGGALVLDDLSDMKSGGAADAAPDAGLIKIPLNGEEYWAVRDPAAETLIAAMGQTTGTGELAAEVAKLGLSSTSIEAIAEANPVLAMRIAAAGMGQTERAIKFLQDVLTPESARRWANAMRSKPQPPPDADPETWQPTDEEVEAHRKRMITMRQCLGVYQRLMAAYSGRPTVPPSSSSNGHGGTGGASTGGAPAEASTP
jgi:hypothetical protein